MKTTPNTPVADLCQRHGLGQTALSRRFGIPLRTVQQWYAGHRSAPEYVVSMMEELLSIDGRKDGNGLDNYMVE